MRNTKKKNKIMILIILLLTVTVGYAIITTQLNVSGSTNITKQNWNIYWENPQVTEGSVSTELPLITAENTVAVWNVTLDWPGDFYEFTIDAVNAGTVDAKITDLRVEITPELPSYITYTVKDATGNDLELNHVLSKASGSTPNKETYRIRVEYNSSTSVDVVNSNEADVEYKYKFIINYGQKNYTPSPDAEIPTIESTCPGEDCVYAFYYNDKYYIDTDYNQRSNLTKYTSNYKNLTYSNFVAIGGSEETYHTLQECMDDNSGYTCVQREGRMDLFLAHILDNENKITRGFACQIYNIDKPNEIILCLEGKNNKSAYKSNKKIMTSLFNDDASIDNAGYSDEKIIYSPSEHSSAVANKDGTVEVVNYSGGKCYVNNDGSMGCGEYYFYDNYGYNPLVETN